MKYAGLLLKMITLNNTKIKVYPHTSLNTFRGMVISPELSTCSIEEKTQPKNDYPHQYENHNISTYIPQHIQRNGSQSLTICHSIKTNASLRRNHKPILIHLQQMI